MMSNTLSKIVIFTVGAAIGSAVTWKLVKTKYERVAQEEIDSVKDLYSKRERETTKEESDPEEVVVDEETKEEYVAKIKEYGYSSNDDEIVKEDEDVERPYVISPHEYDEIGYRTVSLEYFADGVLIDEKGKIIRNVDEVIGIEPEEHFGEYEDDSVFVRDDRKRIDYEILRNEGMYAER